jgi:protein SCO1
MKTKIAILSFLSITLIASLAAVGLTKKISTKDRKIYQVTGRVISLDLDERSIRIRHEEIPDYMPAMTMPFSVKDASLLNRVKPGDSITFQLEVTEEDSWISRIQKMKTGSGSAENEIPPEIVEDISERLEIGEMLPDMPFLDQNRKAIRLQDFRGKALVLTFIYTRCPLPNYCPLISDNFAQLQKRLNKEFAGRFQLLSLTIDPAFDTSEILKSYAIRHDADETSWTFATGSAEELNRAARWFGLTREDAGGLINHDLRTVLVSPEGKLVQIWKSNVWTPYEVQRAVRENLTGSRDFAIK